MSTDLGSVEPDEQEEISPLRRKLQQLSTGLGVRRANLRSFLEDELCALWHIGPSDSPAIVLTKVTWHLERLIAELPAGEYQLAVRVSYNLGGLPGIEHLDLMDRRKALAKRQQSPNPSLRTSGRIMSEALDQFEDSLRTSPPPPVPAEVLARLLTTPAPAFVAPGHRFWYPTHRPNSVRR